jgi:phosphatidylglycerophosphate synthase
MKKLSQSQENPLDYILIILSEKMFPFFKSLGFTPNGLTTLSLLFGVASIYCLYINNFNLFAVTYLISYFFDIMDGGFARAYGMTSTFGCYYDHVKDLIVNLALLMLLIYKNRDNRYRIMTIIAVYIIFGFLMLMNLGCQENIYDSENKNEESPCLSIFRSLCNRQPSNTIKYTRFFGCGTFIIIIIILAYFMNKPVIKPPLTVIS